ncbi:MAG: DivIVA domain-containing protein [Clostridia bacterium]|jgi:cell division initiation protein|nr:DivIVA domain-containing protein [Clostridia bacterium]
MLTPLDIENKKFSKRALNGYSTEEVDDFLDELTLDYEKIYKEVQESRKTIERLNEDITKYRQMESTLQSTLLMAQSAAEEIKNGAREQADSILSQAQASAQSEISKIDGEVERKRMELADMQKQLDTFKANMEGLLISHLELLKNPLKNMN